MKQKCLDHGCEFMFMVIFPKSRAVPSRIQTRKIQVNGRRNAKQRSFSILISHGTLTLGVWATVMTDSACVTNGACPSFGHVPGGRRRQLPARRYKIHVNCAADPSGRVFAYDYFVGVGLSVIFGVLLTLTN